MKSESHKIARVTDCKVLQIERHADTLGTLAVLQNGDEMPFSIKRVFFLYDIPADAERGGHSHHHGEQLLVALSGSYEVKLDDGHQTMTVTLNRPYQGLYIPAGIWRSLHNFTSGAVCLTLCSDNFDEADYVRDYDEFVDLSKEKISR